MIKSKTKMKWYLWNQQIHWKQYIQYISSIPELSYMEEEQHR